LQGKHGTAFHEANEALGIIGISGFNLSNAFIIRGISSYSKGKINEAIQDFTSAHGQSNKLAEFNLWVAQGKDRQKFQNDKPSELLKPNQESICGIKISYTQNIKDYSFN
jgi:hypothetical protein